MKTLGFRIAVLSAACLGLVSYVAGSGASPPTRGDGGLGYPETSKIPVADTLHGTVIVDDYRWLEDGADPRVVDWTAAQEALTHSILDPLPQRDYLIGRFNELWRYDDETVPREVIAGERIFYMAKKKEDEKWTYNTKATQAADPVVLLNPNEWDLRVTLHGVAPSRDGTYLAFGQAHGGDENPVVRVMEVATGRILPDSLTGRRQYVAAWLPDNSGFYYTANPAAGTVPEGDEYYWHAVYLHKLGTPAEEDEKVFFDETVKEHFHGVQISEDGRYEIFVRSMFNKNEVYFKPLGSPEPLIPIATGFDAEYGAVFVDDRLLIRTDADAPLYKVYIAEIAHPERENWREFIPENDLLKLSYVKPITGHIYVGYEENAYSQVKIYDLDGRHLRDFPFPTIGSGGVHGYWSKGDVWVWFSSFTYPPTSFKYDFSGNSLSVYREFPVEVDVSGYTAEQVWYESQDGTRVSMFLVHRKDLKRDGSNPVLLTGYGGFNASMRPYFSTTKLVWLDAGGMIAVPNLRGGGEYGREWHEAGMLVRKQNVFDDFIAAGEWLIANGYTSPDRLGISGGSNGGLLVGAAVVQRPELFRVVNCAVPLLDMVRYHKFGLANIWAEEYGSAEDPEQFAYLRQYSPYHNVKDRTRYPAMLITGSENDARVDPLHARKMVALLQAADMQGGPILLLVRKASGHGGGTTISMQIEQTAETWAFMMDQLGMRVAGE